MSAIVSEPFDVALFDLDGTLVDTLPLIMESFRHTFKNALNIEVPDETIRSFFGETLYVTFARYATEEWPVDKLIQFYREWNIANHDSIAVLFDGVLDMVHELKSAGVKLAVVTSKLERVARMGLSLKSADSERRLIDYFDVIVGIDATEDHKPHPAPGFLALSRLGVPTSSRIVMIGDSYSDIGMVVNAKEVGLYPNFHSVLVGWTTDPSERTRNAATFFAQSPQEIVEIVTGKRT